MILIFIYEMDIVVIRKNLFLKILCTRPFYPNVEINLDIVEDRTDANMEENIFIEDLLNTLPEVQKTIIKEKYIKDHSDIEIAKKLNITRQAVNRSKNRAIENLKKYLCVNLMTV